MGFVRDTGNEQNFALVPHSAEQLAEFELQFAGGEAALQA